MALFARPSLEPFTQRSHCGRPGLIVELPGAIDISAYTEQLTKLRENLHYLPSGDQCASEYESLIGSVIELCFFKALTNPRWTPENRPYVDT